MTDSGSGDSVEAAVDDLNSPGGAGGFGTDADQDRRDAWFLTSAERGNPATMLDSRRGDGLAWSTGNEVTALIHGASYFGALVAAVQRMRAGDLLLFADWRGDPDQLLDDAGHRVSPLLAAAARRGVLVRGLVWRSHWDRLQFSERENRHLGAEIEAAGGICLLDMRVRAGGSHHQKFVVLRHPGRSELDVAFVGGIDLCHSRRDDAAHRGDRQRQPMAAVYGPRPPWHDVQVAIRGPAVGDVETVFRERWTDGQPLSRNPLRRWSDLIHGADRGRRMLPAQLPDPLPAGDHAVQLLRTYPHRRGGYPFAPNGERSVARGYAKVLARATALVYLEDQYFWSVEVTQAFVRALRAQPRLHVVAVLPKHPDQDGRMSMPPNLIGRGLTLAELRAAAPDRFAAYWVENPQGTPVYVHAKVCVVDDTWSAVGSDNFNRRSWTHDSELSASVLDANRDPRPPVDPGGHGDGARRYARSLRLALATEHLERDADADLLQPESAYAAFAESASRLERWHGTGRVGPRPPGRLRPLDAPSLSPVVRRWATPLYRLVYDPDGRPRSMRRNNTF